MENVRIGTCSWKYPSWESLVYEKDSPDSYLRQYARFYNTVEIDQWFWSLGKSSYGLPDPTVVREYNQETPDDFSFTIKCPNTLTLPFAYQNQKERNQWYLHPDVFYQFLETLEPMLSKVGLFMFQFGYLNKDMVSSRNEFLDQISHFFSLLPDGLPYAIELRNPHWMDRPYFEFLRDRNIGSVLLSGYWMENLNSLLEMYGSLLVSPSCIRLHGDDRKAIEEVTREHWNARVINKETEIASIAIQLVKLAQQGKLLFVNVNNHYEGSAPLTIENLMNNLSEIH